MKGICYLGKYYLHLFFFLFFIVKVNRNLKYIGSKYIYNYLKTITLRHPSSGPFFITHSLQPVHQNICNMILKQNIYKIIINNSIIAIQFGIVYFKIGLESVKSETTL